MVVGLKRVELLMTFELSLVLEEELGWLDVLVLEVELGRVDVLVLEEELGRSLVLVLVLEDVLLEVVEELVGQDTSMI